MTQGKIAIELFCKDTGKCVYNSLDNNFISAGVRNYIYQMMMRNLYTNGRLTGSKDFTAGMPDFFGRMYLTTADHAEDPANEWLVRGDIIGNADTTRPTTDSEELKGEYNTSESFTTKDQVHIVVDFPTNAANGLINSIYFGPRPLNYFQSVSNGPLDIGADDFFTIIENDGRYYGFPRFSVADGIHVMDENFNLIKKIKTQYTPLDFTIVGNNIYYVRTASINNNLFKIAIDDELASEETITSINHRVDTITYDDDRQRFIFGYNGIWYIYSNNFELLDQFAGMPTGRLLYYDNVIFTNRRYVTVTDGNNFNPFRYNITRDTNEHIVGVTKDKIFIMRSQATVRTGTHMYPKMFMGSRALLDSPVEKTSALTMKITYDFMLPPLFPVQ